jgi:Rrf2 family transcriptional regulator, iron-sulfur cluster assembly transcription factor
MEGAGPRFPGPPVHRIKGHVMRLTTKGRFAVTAMIDVAMHGHGGPVTLSAVSERQKISLSYLEQLFGKLRRHGLVESVRGPGGGYNLARAADAISVADVILAVDEPIDATQCAGRENCLDDRRCMTHELWAGLNAHIFAYLRSVSLAELVRQQAPSNGGPMVMRDHRPPSPRPTEPVTA